jgi:acetylornithine aminotransferase
MHVWDTEGRQYLDFSAGVAVNALGHGDDQFVKVRLPHVLCIAKHEFRLTVTSWYRLPQTMADAAARILHASNVYHNEHAGKLAELLITLTQQEGGLGYKPGSTPSADAGAKVFFANTGTEANEGALKIARKVGKDRWPAAVDATCDKTEIVCFENAFHGRSMGALSVTPNPKYQKPFAPLLPGVRVGRLNAMEQLEGDALVSEKTCAVIVEPVQGEGGCTAADEAWLRALRKRCDETGAVLIYDEVQVGRV